MKRKVLVFALVIVAVVAIGVFAQVRTPSNIARAQLKGAVHDIMSARAGNVGLNCFLVSEYSCSEMIVRAEENSQLKEALLRAQAENVNVFPGTWPWFNAGSVDVGTLYINTLASDERIIAFLTN